MSSSSVVSQFLAYSLRLGIVNLSKGRFYNTITGMLVILYISSLRDRLSPICRPSKEKNLTNTRVISS